MDIYGVIGWPIEHSLSPVMHNAAFRKLGIDAEYRRFEVKPEELEDFLLNRKDVAGFNITVPHKVKAREILKKKFLVVNHTPYPYYDKMSGAVNTVKRNDGDIEYCNTDPIGFRHSLEEDLKFGQTKGKSVLIMGCGGGSRAVVADLSYPGHYIKRIYLYDINKEAIDSTSKYFSNLQEWQHNLENKIRFIYDSNQLPVLIKECQLLVNASPVGMKEGDERTIIDKNLLSKDLFVFDLVYNRKTKLYRDAKELGAKVVDGRGMLAYQGAFSFSLWTDIKAAEVIGIMKEKLDELLE